MKHIQENQFIVSQPIDKIPLDRKIPFSELIEYLKNWLKTHPKSFRLDGNNKIGPANPSQVIYFEIQDFRKESFNGLEYGNEVSGEAWNGTYFLTAGCRRVAIQELVKLHTDFKGELSKIFELGYTKGQEGKPRKRRVFLKASEEINSGWHCKQYIR